MNSVARYYDENSFWFKLWERAAAPVPVHRRVWAPDVGSGRAALDYVHAAVAAVAREREAASVIDLGCGTGALLSFLYDRGEVPHLVGVTASRVQASEARRWMSARGATGARWEIRFGDYLEPDIIAVAHQPRVFVAVESMVHAPSVRAFLGGVASAAGPGDELFVCDDFLADGVRRTGSHDAPHAEPGCLRTRIVDRFREGWRVPAVTTVAKLLTAAESTGWQLVEEEDWTPWVHRPGPAAAQLFSLASDVLSKLSRRPFVGNLSGGAALRAGYGMGLFRYLVLRLRKASA